MNIKIKNIFNLFLLGFKKGIQFFKQCVVALIILLLGLVILDYLIDIYNSGLLEFRVMVVGEKGGNNFYFGTDGPIAAAPPPAQPVVPPAPAPGGGAFPFPFEYVIKGIIIILFGHLYEYLSKKIQKDKKTEDEASENEKSDSSDS